MIKTSITVAATTSTIPSLSQYQQQQHHFIIPIPSTNISLHTFVSGVETLPSLSATPAPLIILFHGAGGDHYHFDTVVPVLIQSGFTVLTCDLRHHGQSQPLDTASQNNNDQYFDMQILCNDIYHVLWWLKEHYSPFRHDPKRNRDLLFGGLSMGGILAQVCVNQPRSKWQSLGYNLQGMVMIATPSIHMVWPRITWMDLYRNIDSVDPAVLQAARKSIADSAVHEDGKKEAARAMALISDQVLFQCLCASADALSAPPSPPPQNDSTENSRFDHSPIQLPRQLLITGQADEHTVNVMTVWKILNDGLGAGIETVLDIVQDAGHMVPLDQGLHVANAIVEMFYNTKYIV
ncbi:Alpha/Beta hydrolase protein [Phascolomyces articulosus]|uniref:Alpha/Beta hydrolase protein n=1 Tax=Phascolomyces articulosus TaxID=60185 RepID=A0AAD5PGP4_9FUNG|nr:Alpha/Beta hydrolase protein [Phascolomyces articulosus]